MIDLDAMIKRASESLAPVEPTENEALELRLRKLKALEDIVWQLSLAHEFLRSRL